jgi:hypothetical protein
MPLVIVMVLFSNMPSYWIMVPFRPNMKTFILCYLIAGIFLLCVRLVVQFVVWMFLIAIRRVTVLLRQNTPSILSHGKPLGAIQYFNILTPKQTALSSKTSQPDR